MCITINTLHAQCLTNFRFMRKWLVILLLTISSFTGTSVSSGSQNGDNKELTENVHVKQLVDWMATNAIGYDYFKEVHGLNQTNVPNGFPMKVNKLNRISDKYGMRFHPVLKYKRLHTGIDLAGERGTPILAAADGKVVKVAYSVGYGRMVIIEHGNNVKTVYAHLKKFNVLKGQTVSKGDQIAELGSSGMSTGPHLHYEIRVGDKTIDPLVMVGVDEKDIREKYQIIEDYARNQKQTYTDTAEFSEWQRERC